MSYLGNRECREDYKFSSNTLMKNGLFTVGWLSLLDALAYAVVSAILIALINLATMSGFDVFTADWKTIGEHMVNLAYVTGLIALGKDFLTTNTGSFLGITPNSTETIKTLVE